MSLPGVLLVNTGSPDSPEVADVRRYLNQFLMDGRVLDLPWPLRRLIVSAFILPTRPKRSAHAYASIWWPEGSPQVVLGRRLAAALRRQLPYPVALAMRYGNPSVAAGVRELLEQGISGLLLVPLFPHYAMSTTESVVEETKATLRQQRPGLPLQVLPPFYADPRYIAALAASARPYLAEGYDHLLFSFHGVPERHLRKTDPTGRHCLRAADCCALPSPAHALCYRHQVLRTATLVAEALGVPAERYSVAFQSRLGRDRWLQPATTEELQRLAAAGVRRLLVMSPAFVADCLETLEEIGIGGRETFLEAGGDAFTLVPALNDRPEWVSALASLVCEASRGLESR
ncbi:MAG: ferrochelatase [Caldilineales bacterium]|nr:ferrochelatase [Caldilineales bacterium]